MTTDDNESEPRFVIDANGNGRWLPAAPVGAGAPLERLGSPEEVCGGRPRSHVFIEAKPQLLVVFKRLYRPQQMAAVRASVEAYLESPRQSLVIEDAEAVYQLVDGEWRPVFVSDK